MTLIAPDKCPNLIIIMITILAWVTSLPAFLLYNFTTTLLVANGTTVSTIVISSGYDNSPYVWATSMLIFVMLTAGFGSVYLCNNYVHRLSRSNSNLIVLARGQSFHFTET